MMSKALCSQIKKNNEGSMKILTIGGATQDIFILHKDPEMVHFCLAHQTQSFLLLEEGKKIDVENVLYLSGGGATNSAVLFKRCGFETATCFKIGADERGDFILNDLKKEDIDLSNVIRTQHERTAISFIIPSPSGDRTVLCYRGTTQTVTHNEIPFDAFKQFDQLYITSLSGPSAQLLPEIAHAAKKHHIPVATNPGSSQLQSGADALQEALPNIDILILNTEEACMLMASLIRTNVKLQQHLVDQPAQAQKELPSLLQQEITYQTLCFDIKHFFSEVLSRGPKIVVVTNGAEGVYVATHDAILFHPSLNVNVVDTLGAGDAFGSCFVASLLHNYTISESLMRGIMNAASVISFYGAKEGLLSKTALDIKMKTMPTNLVQTFSFK